MSFDKMPNKLGLACVKTKKCNNIRYSYIIIIEKNDWCIVTINDLLSEREKKVKKQVEWEVNKSKRKGGKGWNR